MPSIPQSLLWISLVILWLFVLVPMLISKRDAVRRTSDVALATRVLNSGAAARLLRRRGGPAAGHRSDPNWQPEQDEYDDLDEDTEKLQTSEVVATAADVHVAEEDPEELPVDESATPEPVLDDEVADAEPDDSEDEEDEYEYVDDTSGIPVAEEPEVRPAVARRHEYDTRTAAAVSARKYAFRKRVLLAMAMILAASAAAAFLLTPTAWWVCGTTGGMTVLYLAYLRRQTRIEARLRRRRMQRMARSRLGVENTHDREFDVVPSRLRRPGAVVLEIDDEDPIFEHLDYAPYERDYGWHRDLPRAVGQ
ncbi:divisome protein SepX/GlpR [Mycobacterium branderi]|uniref:Transmembrane protein n=1 Tax=Mycobacterium branderi TaxID=43348 RepID=A0A7I7W624_9MYCO|nr:gephyrin-like molybdotransferase receptor GlpR [Mycobacterium branderi]MCV7231090.1 hypothetical protein [Mycobacterium branderi]ORA39015.1 hypothetical protein BST20_10805 [Mycobacterium branderi]BBZ12387.1 hypothetical protein MBRA_25820 [Mycobacterium branderi]